MPQSAEGIDKDFDRWELEVEEGDHEFSAIYYIPKSRTSSSLNTILEQDKGYFDSILYISLHREDLDGEYEDLTTLKQSIDFIAEVNATVLTKAHLRALPSINLILNQVALTPDQEKLVNMPVYDYEAQRLLQHTFDPYLRQAKRFTKKSLRCRAFMADEV